MAVNKIVLLTIVSIFIAYGHTAPEVLNDEFTVAQLKGEWLDIGRISSCNAIKLHPCITHFILAWDDTNRFAIRTIPYENIPQCDRGVPIFDWFVRGSVNNSKFLFQNSSFHSAMNATIKSYNNGTELIFTETTNESCSGTSYRLWSRERKVSAETKAEFEKLAGNRTVEYFPWDHCPIVRSEVHEAPVDLVHDGIWYDIAEIDSDNWSENRSCINNVTVNHADNTIIFVCNLMQNGRPSVEVSRGRLLKFGTLLLMAMENRGYFLSYVISCNKGEHQISVLNGRISIHLSSRNPKVPAETLAEFRRLFDMVKREMDPTLVYITFPQDYYPK